MPDMSYHGEPHATAHWAWFNPPHVATSVEYDHEWPPLPGSTGTAGAPAVVQMPGGPPIDDGGFDNELDVEFNHELDGDLEAGAEEDWEGIEDELPALEDAGHDNAPAVVPHQFLFHRATNCECRSSLACFGLITSHTSHDYRLHKFHGAYPRRLDRKYACISVMVLAVNTMLNPPETKLTRSRPRSCLAYQELAPGGSRRLDIPLRIVCL